MFRAPGLASFSLGVLTFLFTVNSAGAQVVSAPSARALITQNIDEGNVVALSRNTRAEANAANDRGAVADDFQMQHMLLQLRRSSEQEHALQQYIDELQEKGSPNFHRWITAQEFGARFGLAKQDLDTITGWLVSHGFKVNVVYPNGMVIDFSGSAGQVREAFKTEIHHLEVSGENHVANMSDPRIPAALAPAIAGIVSLHDFRPQTMHKMHTARPNFTFNDSFGGTTFALVPADLATIYNLNPLFNAGYSGQGQTIVVIEDTDVFSTLDWNTFRSTLGLSSYSSGSFSRAYPTPPSGTNNCNSPGVIAPNDAEAILDAEWASAAAPNAAIEMAICADTTTTFGGLIALQNLINANGQPPAIVSISYGQCETQNGASANAAYNSVYQQAVSEGVSVFVAAGDSGAAGCDNSVSNATHGIGVNAFASTPYNVAVGGTDFSDTYSGTNNNYWNSTNGSTYGSALSYIPEIPWNDSCAGELLSTYEGYPTPYGSSGFCNSPLGGFLQTTVAGGGGPSGCASGAPSVSGDVDGSCQGWPKPSWQSVLGNPNDGVRDTPDISLFAADGLWSHYYVFCWSDTKNGGAACLGAPSGWSGAGGTSFASPIMAGIQALVNQKAGGSQGNPNPAYYQLATTEYGSNGTSSCNSSSGSGVASNCIFYDVTQGDMDVNCTGNVNCFLPSGTSGVLSTSDSSFRTAYGSTAGWDFATGIGSINAANLVNNWPSSGPNYSLSASPSSLTLTQGGSGGSTITVNAQNGFSANVTLSASGLPSGVTASFSPNPASTASTMTLTASSTAAIGTIPVIITGTSDGLTNTTTITLTVNPVGNYTLSASPSSLSITRGASGAGTIIVTPQGGFSSSVTLSTSGLPSGVTASFSPNPASTASTMTLTASSTATIGTVSVTITGTSGSLTNTTTITLTITAAPNYSLSASPSSLTLTQGGSGGSTITVNAQNGFSGNVTLSTSSLPSGVSASFSPNPATATSTLTFTANGTASTGTATVTITGISGSVTNTTTITLTVTAVPTLPSVWSDGDIGSVGITGSASYANGTFTVKGAGTSVTGAADGLHFVYQSLSGDGTIVARVVTLNANAAAGLMIRETLSANSRTAFLQFYNPNIYFSYRASTGGSVGYAESGTVSLPYWVSLVRSGSTVTASISSDGVNWVQLSSQTISMATNVYIGLGVTSGSTTRLATGTLDNVSVNSAAAPAPVISNLSATTGPIGSQVMISGSGFGTSQGSSAVMLNGTQMTVNSWSATSISVTVASGATSGPMAVLVAPSMNASNPVTFAVTSQPLLPTPWLDQDIGPVGLTGSASYANGTFTVKGAGTSVTGAADGLHFVYQSLSGDGTIVARVVTLNANAAAGLMIRETLSANSRTAFLQFYNPNIYFSYRASTGGSVGYAESGTVSLPYWVSLVRSGSTVTASISSDGVNWVQLSSQTISMATNVYIGLGVTSGSTTRLATGTLDNVSVNSAAAPAPVISNLSATTGPIGSQVMISGSGFGTSQGSSAVMLNGTQMTVNSWSATSISVTVASGATSGPMAVLVAPSMNASNPVTFAVTTAPAPNYSLSASPSSLSITRGASGAGTIIVTPQGGFSSSVTLSTSGLPSGVTASFSPNPASTASTMTLTASSTATIGTVSVTITGTSGSLTNTTTITLTITAAPNYSLSASPSSLTLTQGGSGGSTITVNAQNGFSGNVTLSTSSLPSGVSASFSPNPATATSTLTFTANGTASTGTATVTITGISGSVTNTTTITLTVTAVPTLPSVWSDGDIGSVGITGSASYANGTFTVKGAGTSVTGAADGLHFVYQSLSGDGTIVARVVTLNANAAAGLMIRETLSANSRTAFLQFYNPNIYFSYRASTGGSVGYAESGTVSLPYWVSLVRSGSTVTASISSDGVNWVQLSSQTISMATNVYIGLGVTSGSTTRLATGTLDNVSVNSAAAPAPVISNLSATTGPIGSQVMISGSGFGTSQGSSAVMLNGTQMTVNSWSATSISVTVASGATSGPMAVLVAPSMNASNPVTFAVTSQPLLPTPWLDQDIGPVGLTGSASYANGTFTVKGAGTSVTGAADGLHFVYQSLSGDGTIVARVVTLNANAAAGLMIRETLSANSRTAFLQFYNPNIYFSYRASTGGSVGYAESGTVSLPYWVSLVRSGSTVTASISSDGVNWVQLSSQTISMATNVYIGLGVTSGSTTRLATGTLDNVSVNSAAAPAPVISNLSATTGPIGSQVMISGSGSGTSQGSSAVMLNGTQMTVNSWSATSISVTVASGATSGPMAVLVAPSMNASNPVTFAVTTN